MSLDLEILDAFEKPGNVLVPDLKGYDYVPTIIEYDEYPFMMSPGGFCLTFPMANAGQKTKKCLRLWFNDKARVDNLAHIKNVAGYFNLHQPHYVVKYKYVEQALRLLNGKVIPGVVMDWIEGDTLIEYVRKNYRKANVMRSLAKTFYNMVDYLNHNNMAHGDLSGENIIVTSMGNMVLIDYDSFFVKGQPTNIEQPTKGVPAYQHPAREANQFLNTYMDFFSQQIIYLSLIAIAEKPSLFNSDSDKELIFQNSDLSSQTALVNSAAYKAIASIPNQEVKDRLEDLRKDIALPLDKVRSLTAIYDRDKEKRRREEEVRNRPKPQDRVVPKENKEVKRTVSSFASFCGYCGYRFPIERDNAYYCPICGSKRAIIHQTYDN